MRWLRSIAENIGILRPTYHHYEYCALMDYRTAHFGCDCRGK